MQFRANDRVSINLGSDGVAQVRLTRPEKMNALDPEMFARIIEAGQALHEMKGLRAVVLSGEGRAFCAGLDLSNFGKQPDPEAPGIPPEEGPRQNQVARARYRQELGESLHHSEQRRRK